MHGYEVTNCGLHEWTRKAFEKLGWMVYLQYKMMKPETDEKLKGHIKLKLISYQNELEDLYNSLQDKMKVVEEMDRKTDLQIELEKVRMLRIHVSTHMNQQMGGRKKTSKKK